MKACGDKDSSLKAGFRPGLFRVVAASCAIAAGILGCSDKAVVVPESRRQVSLQKASTAIKSVADLRKLIVPGMTANEVTAKLGQPDWEETTSSGVFWHYQLIPFPADDEMKGTHVIGVIVGLTNGHVAKWSCAYAGETSVVTVTSRESLVDVANGARSTVLKFFVVSSHPVEQGRFVDTDKLPKLGYISSKPELVINRLKEVTMEERRVREADAQSRTVWVFKCSLDEQVAAQFKAMTTTNVLKRVLIMVGDEPIVALTIFAPLEDGRFEIECQDRSLMEFLKKQLVGRERQGQ